MIGFISKLFGGNKSDKDIKSIMPVIEQAKQFIESFKGLSNDALRAKTGEFRARIKEYLREMDASIADLSAKADALTFSDISGKDALYNEIDELKKKAGIWMDEQYFGKGSAVTTEPGEQRRMSGAPSKSGNQ